MGGPACLQPSYSAGRDRRAITWQRESDMAGLEIRDFSAPVEVRRPQGVTVEVGEVGGGEVGRYTFEPGWR